MNNQSVYATILTEETAAVGCLWLGVLLIKSKHDEIASCYLRGETSEALPFCTVSFCDSNLR